MINVEGRQRIPRACFIEKKTLREIAREFRVARKIIGSQRQGLI